MAKSYSYSLTDSVNIPVKIISGGQTGADIAGIDFARKYNFNWGGTIPKDARTDEGFIDLGVYTQFELSPTTDYRDRTRENVRNSHITVIFHDYAQQVSVGNGPGVRCTISACLDYQKRYIKVNPLIRAPQWAIDKSMNEIVNMIRKAIESEMQINLDAGVKFTPEKPFVVNIAGNREAKAKGIYFYTFVALERVFCVGLVG